MRSLAAVEHADADVQHALADPLGQQLEIDAGPDLSGRVPSLEDREHGGVDGRRRLASQITELVARGRRGVVQREQQRSPMTNCAYGDGLAEVDDALVDRPRVEL